jgi:hypothetical protein
MPSLSQNAPTSTAVATGLSALPAAVGSTPTSFAVSKLGTADYSIPIWSPPGVGDVQLKLTLSYTSRGPNGLEGMGWSITGLSSITRCNKTYAIEAREILKKFGIGINDAANGVFLPGAKHASTHTGNYFKAVTNALKGATTKSQAEQILRSIGQGLQNGAFP